MEPISKSCITGLLKLLHLQIWVTMPRTRQGDDNMTSALKKKKKKEGGVLFGQLLYKGKPSTLAKAVEEVHLIKSAVLMQLT